MSAMRPQSALKRMDLESYAGLRQHCVVMVGDVSRAERCRTCRSTINNFAATLVPIPERT
jgi:hypothetical protein